MLIDSLGLVPVRPGNDDVLSVTFVQAIPLLITEYVEIENIKVLEMLFYRS